MTIKRASSIASPRGKGRETLAFALLKGASTKLEPVAVEDITTPEEHLRRVSASDGVGRAAVPA